MDDKSPVVERTATAPTSSANAGTGASDSVNGSSMASIAVPPRPGSRPTTAPIAMPAASKPSAGHDSA